ncbi:MAG: rRNA maturation RNase YbeY [bacterium]|nr:rRNA maturation RNase YbeY [Gammaproteobacteria bacterium]HIL97065.1 rRNA maturation RNase YbeY [Pseudomonadales bacterium]
MATNCSNEIEISRGCHQNPATMPEDELIKAWSSEALMGSGIGGAEVSVSIRIVSSEEMTSLNSEFRSIKAPTNVLSFPMDTELDGGRRLLGDIAICADVVIAEAREQGKSNHAHFAHMLVHGILHLRGFDHLEDDQALKMEQIEVEILRTMGFPNPYRYPTA